APTSMNRLCIQESLEYICGVFRIFFREEVAPLHHLSLHVRSPLPPNAQWATLGCVEGVERATLGPQMQHRAFDASGSFLVCAIVLDIDGCCGSIFLTDAMNAGGIAKGYKVLVENLCAKGTVSEGILENGLGSAKQIVLWEWLLL